MSVFAKTVTEDGLGPQVIAVTGSHHGRVVHTIDGLTLATETGGGLSIGTEIAEDHSTDARRISAGVARETATSGATVVAGHTSPIGVTTIGASRLNHSPEARGRDHRPLTRVGIATDK